MSCGRKLFFCLFLVTSLFFFDWKNSVNSIHNSVNRILKDETSKKSIVHCLCVVHCTEPYAFIYLYHFDIHVDIVFNY